MGSRPPWATARRSGKPGNKEFNAPEADFGQAQGRLVFADEQCPPRQKKVAAFRGRAMLAPTLLTKCGSRTNLSVGFAASSLRQKKLAALGFESAFRGGRPSQPSVRTGQLPQRGSQEGGAVEDEPLSRLRRQLPLERGALGVLTQGRTLHVRVLEQAKQKEDERCSPLRIGKSEESKVKKQGTSQSFALQKTAPLGKGSL